MKFSASVRPASQSQFGGVDILVNTAIQTSRKQY